MIHNYGPVFFFIIKKQDQLEDMIPHKTQNERYLPPQIYKQLKKKNFKRYDPELNDKQHMDDKIAKHKHEINKLKKIEM